jgi:hypothetical protein
MVYWTQEQIGRIYAASCEEKLAVFMGSGVSASSGLPDWDGLIQDLLSILDNPSVYRRGLRSGVRSVCMANPLQGLDYLRKMDEQAFGERFRARFPQAREKYSDTREGILISRLATKRYITINYDFCFQHSFAKTWPGENVSELSNSVLDTHTFDSLPKPTLYQLHGTAEHKISDLVLTDSQYDKAYTPGSPLVKFLEHLFANYLVLFAGFGFQDKDLIRVLARPLNRTEDGCKYKHIGVFGRSRKKNDAEAFRDFARRLWNTEVVFYDMSIVAKRRSHLEIIPLLSELSDGLRIQAATHVPVVSYETHVENMSVPPSLGR